MTQDDAIKLIDEGHNVFVTGSAGSGKSFLIRSITDKNTILCSPTGVAALNIGGITCHKAFGLPIGIPTPSDEYTISKKTKNLFNIYSNVKRIIIDEISMVRRDYLELIDKKLQRVRGNNNAFGGLQVIVVGDFLQLSPVLTSMEAKEYYKKWDSVYAFTSDSWKFINIELTHCFRQDNPEQVSLLGNIRKGQDVKESLDKIVSMSKPYEMNENTTHLCSRKKDVAMYNRMFYNKLSGDEMVYEACVRGEDVFGNEPVVPRKLSLKKGCRVIIKGNDLEGAYANGEMGTVEFLSDNYVVVRKDSGSSVTLQQHVWQSYDYETVNGELKKKIIGEYYQIPLMLGYAITIHSCQGTTLDSVAIDTGGDGCFTHGQLYVSLSRIKDLANMSFASEIDYDEVICDKEVLEFYEIISVGDILWRS